MARVASPRRRTRPLVYAFVLLCFTPLLVLVWRSKPTASRNARIVLPRVYTEKRPLLTAIVQSFNHVGNVANISGALVSSAHVHEVVICEDGSSDGSLDAWVAALTGLRHFVVRSNNLHEMRAYNRAMRIADGRYVLLLQDDDLLPADDTWIATALQLLERYPHIGILGGYIGQLWDDQGGYEYGEQVSTHGGVRKGKTKPIPFVDPLLNVPFMFVECAWNAPLFVRRDLILATGGLNLDIAKRGEPGVWQDCVWAYEAWSIGYTVAVYNAPFVRGVGGHGSAATPAKLRLRDKVWKRAVALTNRKYDRRGTHDNARRMNRRHLKRREMGVAV